MIGRVYRGGRVGGLLRYLYGPGRHNEHVDPHLVASWDGGDEATLLALEPREDEQGYDVRRLAAELDAPLAYAPPRRTDRHVWHCPLRLADDDRRLTDEQWREVAEDVLHRTGIAPRGDEGGCRWVAVRHDEVSIHLVAVLARQDGRPVRLWRDYLRVREACLAAEQRYGLQVTAPADGTAAPRPGRAESEKAARVGRPEEPRVRLRRDVRACAVAAESTDDFLARVRSSGLLVRERYGEAGDLTGYAVAVPGDTTAAGLPIWYGGGRLAPDLTLPRLQARWGGSEPATSARSRAELADDLRGAAADLVTRARAGRLAPAMASEAQDALIAAGVLLGGRDGDAVRRAVDRFDRAAREPGLVRRPGAGALRAAARRLARSGRATGSLEGAAALELVAALVALSEAVAEWHERNARPHQVAAARAAQKELLAVATEAPRHRAAGAMGQRPSQSPTRSRTR